MMILERGEHGLQLRKLFGVFLFPNLEEKGNSVQACHGLKLKTGRADGDGNLTWSVPVNMKWRGPAHPLGWSWWPKEISILPFTNAGVRKEEVTKCGLLRGTSIAPVWLSFRKGFPKPRLGMVNSPECQAAECQGLGISQAPGSLFKLRVAISISWPAIPCQ